MIEQYRGKLWTVITIDHLSRQILDSAEFGIGIEIEIDKGKIIHISTFSCPAYEPSDMNHYHTLVTKIKSNLLSCVYQVNSTIRAESTGDHILLNFVTERDVLL